MLVVLYSLSRFAPVASVMTTVHGDCLVLAPNAHAGVTEAFIMDRQL
jgi:hypothetical protein